MDSKIKNSNKKQKHKKRQCGTNGSTVAVADAIDEHSFVDIHRSVRWADALCERPHSDMSYSGSDLNEEEDPTSSVCHDARRGGGWLTTTGQYVNLDKAQEALLEVECGQKELQDEAEMFKMTRRARVTANTRLSENTVSSEAVGCNDAETLEALENQLKSAVAIVLKVSNVSRSLSDTCSTVLEDAAASIKDTAATLFNPNSFEEIARLKGENFRLQDENVYLQAENSLLQEEVVNLRKEVAKLKVEKDREGLLTDLQIEEVKRKFMLKAESLMDARFATIEDRLLPPKHQGILPAVDYNADQSADAIFNEIVQNSPESSLSQQPRGTTVLLPEVPVAADIEISNVSAQNLRTTLNQNYVRDSRITKYAEVRISGLADTFEPEEVVTAIAQAGGCHPSQLKCSEIREHPRGYGVAVVRCPVAVANKLVAQKVVVGWFRVKVKLLEPRPPRCFRCLHTGHVGADCTSDVDRSDICFRCGQYGHKAVGCTAAPHCVICAAARKPANHPAGSKACGVIPNKEGKKRVTKGRNQ